MKKLLSTAIAVGIFTSMSIAPAFSIGADVLPSLNNATNADVTTTGSNMNVQIQGGQGGVGTLNWNNYNIGSNAAVNYEFTAHNQTALNQVNAAGGLSQIYGKITSSGCSGCGYDATGKVILINPNGVLFGDGANVNLNSFTVSTMDGVYDASKNQLNLVRNGQSKEGIVVMDGAKIHGDKGVTFASDNVRIYSGSKISTNIAPNDGVNSFGKIKIVTSDGVNFTYYDNGAVDQVTGIKESADKMSILINNSTLEAGHIDARNYSANNESQINLNGATLKATKAVNGNDGNIWLTASNNIITGGGTTFTTKDYSADAAKNAGGNVRLLAGNKVTLASTDIDAVGDVKLTSQKFDVNIHDSNVNTAKNLIVNAAGKAAIEQGSTVNAKNVTLNGGKRAQVLTSKVNADSIELVGDDVWFKDANLAAANIKANAKNNITGDANLNNGKASLTAGKDINVKLSNVGNRNNGLIAKAGNDMTITTDGALSVSSLISGNDMTINAKEVISGFDKTQNSLRTPGDSADRAYIEVGGKFTSTPGFEVTDSADLTADGAYQQRHHIQYGDGSEKILLVNKRPYVANNDDNNSVITVDEDQSQMLNKLPRQPETFSNVTNVTDGRTTFVDVFAAASQIEIVDDEEEE